MLFLLKDGFTPRCFILNFHNMYTGKMAYLPIHIYTLFHFERVFKLGAEGNPR